MKAGLVFVPFVVVACGPKAIEHSGYPDGETQPWTKAKTLVLDERLETKADGTVSYPQRKRAKWYVVNLPADGALTATVSLEPRGPGADLGVEVLDSGFNVVSKAEDDEGEPKKTRVAAQISGGKAYVHVYSLKRDDEVDYTVRLRFQRVAPPRPTDEIPNPPELPAVVGEPCPPGTPPDKCDGPVLPACPPGAAAGTKCVCVPGNTAPPCAPRCTPGVPAGTACICDDAGTPPPCPAPPIYAAISEISKPGEGVNMVLNKGQDARVEKGCTGVVLVGPKGEKELPNGRFVIREVMSTESRANIPRIKSLDEMSGNTRAKLTCVTKQP